MCKVYVPAKRTNEIAAALTYDPALDTVGLLRELRYYCMKREEAGRPVPAGNFELQYDCILRLSIRHEGNKVLVMGVVA
jgi:hypothetical protein